MTQELCSSTDWHRFDSMNFTWLIIDFHSLFIQWPSNRLACLILERLWGMLLKYACTSIWKLGNLSRIITMVLSQVIACNNSSNIAYHMWYVMCDILMITYNIAWNLIPYAILRPQKIM